MKILLADVSPVVRYGIQLLGRGHVFIEVATAKDMMNKLYSDKFDLLILDIELPDFCFTYLGDIRKNFKSLPVCVFTNHPEDFTACAAIEEGATSYVSKTSSVNVLKEVIAAPASRKLSLELSMKVAEYLQMKNRRTSLLSNREKSVMALFGQGLTVTGIGKRLNLSARTISTYRTRIMQKLSFKTTAEIIRYAVSGGKDHFSNLNVVDSSLKS